MDTGILAPATDDRSGWPKTGDGTTDWEQVFEDTDTGIIPLIGGARTTAALHESAIVVISMLYTRKNDRTEAARMTRDLDARIDEAGDVDHAREIVIEVLRGIKARRIRLAEKHIEQMRQDEAREAAKAEAGTLPPMPKSDFRGTRSSGTNKLTIGALVAGLVVVVAIAFFVLSGSDEGADEAEDEGAVEQQAAAEAPPPEKPAPKPKQKAKPKPPPVDPLLLAVKPIYWSPTAPGVKRTKFLYRPVMRLASTEGVRRLCTRFPQINDAVQVAMLQGHPTDRPATETELVAIGKRMVKAINERAGLKVVAEVDIGTGAGPRRGTPKPPTLRRRCGR